MPSIQFVHGQPRTIGRAELARRALAAARRTHVAEGVRRSQRHRHRISHCSYCLAVLAWTAFAGLGAAVGLVFGNQKAMSCVV
jgi:hypothetical protein